MNTTETHFVESFMRVTMFNRPWATVAPVSAATPARILGIWRLGACIARGAGTDLYLAQPADSQGNPRYDYVLKTVATPAATDASARRPGSTHGSTDRRCAPNGRSHAPPANAIRDSQRQISQSIQAAGVKHPNLIAILDASHSPHAPYIVMPRLEALPMDERTRQIELFAVPVALWWARQIAQALETLHQAGWVHGDVKPDNVLVDAKGHVTLIDLGFAARVHTPMHRVFRGTPDYASPELTAGTTAALPAMDTFALGRVLWQSLAATTAVDTAALEPVAELIEKMVATDPLQRPAIGEVARQLLALEIQTLGGHIGPTAAPRRVKRAA